jgi:tRNA (adenine37-N6)-methyltransferase
MSSDSEIRAGEIASHAPIAPDASITFIGVIRTPFATRADCPRQGKIDGPECTVVVYERWVPALAGLEAYGSIELLYWLDRSRRDLIVQTPMHGGNAYGTFALRSPNRPNPIGTSFVKLERIEDDRLIVRGLDCIDGTPLVDIKPDRCTFTPKAPDKPADAK